MKTHLAVVASLLLTIMVGKAANAQGVFKVETGQAFSKIIPKDFVLEANAIPTEKRNSALVITPSGSRLVVGLLATSGYSSQVQEKYTGMLITEGRVNMCGNPVTTGSYGFGIGRSPGIPESHAAKFILYNQGGQKVTECSAGWDARIKHPAPLRVVVGGMGSARLYLGRTWVELK